MTIAAAHLDRLLDADALSTLVGRPVRAASVRAKPGTLVVLGLADDTGRPVGWARVLWPTTRAKAAKTTERAGRRGLSLVERPLADGLWLQAGGIATDPGLANPVWGARPRRIRELVGDPGAVLRHNPMRRVLVRDGDAVTRVASSADPLSRPLLLRLALLGLPVPEVLDDGLQSSVSVRRFFGDTDLLHHPSTDGARWAGEALAGLHASTTAALADPAVAAHLGRRRAERRAPSDALHALEPALGARLTALAERRLLREPLPGPDVLLHGDASADQVLVDTTNGSRQLNDFDRATRGPAALDLGSWLAVDRVEGAHCGDALLEGYAQAGGHVPDAAHLTTALAHGLLARVTTPLRSGDPAWRQSIAARLDDLAEVLG